MSENVKPEVLKGVLDEFAREIESKCVKKVWRAYAYNTFEEKLLCEEVCQTKEQAKQALVDTEDAGFYWGDDNKLEREDDEDTIEWSVEEEEITDEEKLKTELATLALERGIELGKEQKEKMRPDSITMDIKEFQAVREKEREQGKLDLEKETEKHYANVVYPKTGDDDEFYRTGWEDCIDFLRLKSQIKDEGEKR